MVSGGTLRCPILPIYLTFNNMDFDDDEPEDEDDYMPDVLEVYYGLS